ncbi:daunorubicin resistance protein DrrA family ABC transporter ATP-binding protein [Nonomuraea rosea]|uniref:Daunorubicin resistance protein DrrA family ABC transporter ATP-binding protein n=1 Tax=Nonomuraea rosea TaxID=638574 RepID=A0ABP6ZTH2_9ACTN
MVRHAARVRRLIGLTGQYASVDEDLTGAENLVLIGRLLDLRGADAKARAARLLEEFGLAEAGERRAGTYSGGMRRRLDLAASLAASLVGRPDVIFLDEPTTGLDPAKREDVWNIIRRLVTDGGTVLLTTQYLDEADALADAISVVDHGKVIAHGTAGELKHIVGGQTVLVRPADAARMGEAAAIIAAVAGRPAESPGRDVVTVPVEGDAAFTEIVRRLDAAGIAVTELSLRLSSLDEVFFTLTGHGTRQEEAACPAPRHSTAPARCWAM